MYIRCVEINIAEPHMPIQIANPAVVSKVERAAKRMGLNKTAVVDRALDRLLSESDKPAHDAGRLAALLAQLDRIPDRSDKTNPLQWDKNGLPK
jgi:antitoxin VapB